MINKCATMIDKWVTTLMAGMTESESHACMVVIHLPSRPKLALLPKMDKPRKLCQVVDSIPTALSTSKVCGSIHLFLQGNMGRLVSALAFVDWNI